jgi:hypothetical protein
LCGQFAGDRGKRGFKEVGEEKRKEEALRVEREEVEEKRKRRSSETAAVVARVNYQDSISLCKEMEAPKQKNFDKKKKL